MLIIIYKHGLIRGLNDSFFFANDDLNVLNLINFWKNFLLLNLRGKYETEVGNFFFNLIAASNKVIYIIYTHCMLYDF